MGILNKLWFRFVSPRARNYLKVALYQLNFAQKRKDTEAYKNCQTIEDYLEFSAGVFGVYQVPEEICGLLEFATKNSVKNVCEIGVAAGGTDFLLREALPDVKLMIGVDLFVQNQPKLLHFHREDCTTHYIEGSSYSDKILEKVGSVIGEEKLDLLFIDGDHSYDGVKKDFLLYKDFVRDGGIIVFHDIVDDYGTKHGQPTDNWAGDVPKFWQEVKESYQHVEFVKDPEQDGKGIGVIIFSE